MSFLRSARLVPSRSSAVVVAAVALVSCAGHTVAQVVGGFSVTRGGRAAWAAGSGTVSARAAVSAAFPGMTSTASDTLTPAYLASIDVLIIATAVGDTTAITPLSLDERSAVSAFLAAGGRALIFSDNDAFSPSAAAANASVLQPLGMTSTGTFFGVQTATLTPGANPLATGPFGAASSYTVNFPGWFTSVGSGTIAGTLNSNGAAAAVLFDSGALAPGSGRVAAFSDTALLDADFGQNNRTVFLNAFGWVVPSPGAAAALALTGLGAAARRRRG